MKSTLSSLACNGLPVGHDGPRLFGALSEAARFFAASDSLIKQPVFARLRKIHEDELPFVELEIAQRPATPEDLKTISAPIRFTLQDMASFSTFYRRQSAIACGVARDGWMELCERVREANYCAGSARIEVVVFCSPISGDPLFPENTQFTVSVGVSVSLVNASSKNSDTGLGS
jgi:hypothetical protein